MKFRSLKQSNINGDNWDCKGNDFCYLYKIGIGVMF